MRSILPPQPRGPDNAEPDQPALLARSYAPPQPLPGRAHVRASMVSSIDGSAVGADGRSGSLGGPADEATFAVLRGYADAVLVGVGTALAERYGAPEPDAATVTARRGRGQTDAPLLAVVSSSLRIPADAPLLTAPGRVLVLSCEQAPRERRRRVADHVEVVSVGDEAVDVSAAVALLVGRGHRQILCEGGPRLLGSMVAADLVDELCLTLDGVLVGGGGPRVLATADPVTDARTRLTLAHVLEHDGVLLTRWLRPAGERAGAAPAAQLPSRSARSKPTGSSSWS